MNDLISRKALLAEYDRVHIGEPGKARKLIEDAPDAVRWIPVEERFPNKANSYICRCIVNNCADMPFYMVLSYILYDKNPHFQHETTGGMKVTHWMPLPQPPKEA